MVLKQEEILTVLFADLAGSSRLYDVLGDEKARKIVAEGLSALSRVVRDHHGKVVKAMGDEILCVFDVVDQAASTALKMQRVLKTISLPDVTIRYPLVVRIGFHCGPVIWEGKDLFGNTVNMAARLVSRAKSKQVLTTGQTLGLLPDGLRESSRFVERTAVKGIQEEFDIYEMMDSTDESVRTFVIRTEGEKAQEGRVRLVLSFGEEELTLNRENRTLTIGRDEENDLTISGDTVSRYHARIEYRRDRFVLVDMSTNGTHVEPDGGKPSHVHRDEILLEGSGRIGLGEPPEGSALAILYEQIEP